MIVLDSCVLSEDLRPSPDPRVRAWLAAADDELALTTITVGEMMRGALVLPEGRRRDGLLEAIETMLDGARVLVYDEDAARCYAQLHARRRQQGRPLAVEDGMIAAICGVAGAAVATRNLPDFADLDIVVHNPWTDAPPSYQPPDR